MDEFGKEKQQVRAAKDVQKFYDPISVWGGGGGGGIVVAHLRNTNL